MLITRKLFNIFNYLCLGNILKLVQLRTFYSTYNGNLSPSIVPVVYYLNADIEKDAAIKQK